MYCESPEHQLLLRRQQVPAPVDHRHQRLLPRCSTPMTSSEQSEPVVESRDQPVHTKRTYSSSGKLQSERNPIKPTAKHRDARSRLFIQNEPSVPSSRPGN